MSDLKQKTNFAILNKVDAFYTEGKIQATEDGNYLLCSFGEKINFLNVLSGTVEHSLAQEDEVEVANFLVSHNNKILVTANKDGVLRQWCMLTKKLVRYWRSEHRSLVSCMDYDRTSTLLATGSADSTVKVWDLDQQCCTNILRGHVGVVSIVKFNPHKRYQLVSASDDYKIKIWDLQTHLCDAELKGHCSAVTALQFADDAKSMYSASRDQAVIIWNLLTFTKISTIPVFESVESMVLLPTDYKEFTFEIAKAGDLFVIAGNKGVLSLWDASKAKCIYKTKEIEKDSTKEESDAGLHTLTQCGFVKATDSIFTVSADGNLSVYSRKDLHLQKQFTGHNGQILDIKFLGKNDSHIAVATNSSLLKVYDVATWSCQILSGHTDNIVSLDSLTTGDSLYIISGSKDNKICLWKMNPESSVVEKVAVGVGHTHTVTSVSFFDHSVTNGSEMLSIVTGSTDHTIKHWKTKKTEDGETKLDPMLTVEAHEKDINSITCFRKKKLIATASQDKTAKLWNEDLSLLGVFKGHKRGIWCVQLHPLDTILATASADTTIRLWNVNDFTCVKTFEGHESSVLKLNFLSRGTQLVSCGSDGLMKLWTVRTNECVKTIDAHDEKVWAMAINAAEDRIVTGATDGCIVVWKDVSEEEKSEASKKNQELLLKEQELMNLLHGKQFTKALSLAIMLNQPSRALNIVKEILKSSPDSMETALADLREDQIDSLLGFAAVWNQNTKHCHVAQVILNIVLKRFTLDQMLQFGNIKTLIEGLIPYSERHFARMNQLAMKATFSEYIWLTMKLSAPSEMNGTKSLGAAAEDETRVAPEEDMEIAPEGDMEVEEMETRPKKLKKRDSDMNRKTKKSKLS